MKKKFAKSLSSACTILLMAFSFNQPASAYSPIANVEGYDANQLEKLGITVKSWKHETIGEDPPQKWVEVTYDWAKWGKDRNVLMTAEVVSDEAKKVPGIREEYITETIGAFRAEHKKGDTDKLKLLFTIREKNIENSHVQIILPESMAEAGRRPIGDPGIAGYSLSMRRILQLAKDGDSTVGLPTAEQVKSISVKFKHPKLKDVEFETTAGDFTAIRSNLLPAKFDPKPALWEWLGTVKIVKKDGDPFLIELYETSDGPGAFAVGATAKDRKYFRGGDTGELIAVLSAAFGKAKDNPSEAKVDSEVIIDRKERIQEQTEIEVEVTPKLHEKDEAGKGNAVRKRVETLSHVTYNKDRSLFVGYYQDGWHEMVSLHDGKTKEQLGSIYCDGGIPGLYRFSEDNKFLGARTDVGWHVWAIPSFDEVFVLGDIEFERNAQPKPDAVRGDKAQQESKKIPR